MHILLLVAHGSRREESNIEIASLSKKISTLEPKEFDKVMPAFLEFASPSITEAIKECTEVGATKVTILPYFLSAGVHITRDIPNEISEASQNNPDLDIQIANYFGSRDEIAEILMKTALDIK
ncbi:sirohydrochlorin chelatase [Candidatus Pseudothioglobus sp. Uisw_050_01]|uniref:sirohydrochlorin chelatase n=1 Tax=Candidatus Pseudothioglobus sp. Uisw_050_01 TaxID=3230997 RepID=UPI003A89C492